MINLFHSATPVAPEEVPPSDAVQAAMLESAADLGRARRIRADIGAALAALVAVADRVGVTTPPTAA